MARVRALTPAEASWSALHKVAWSCMLDVRYQDAEENAHAIDIAIDPLSLGGKR